MHATPRLFNKPISTQIRFKSSESIKNDFDACYILDPRKLIGFRFKSPSMEGVKKISVDFDPQSNVTKDNVKITATGTLSFRVIDPNGCCRETHDILTSIVTNTKASMNFNIGLMEFNTLFHDRSALNEKICESIRPMALKCGVDILRYEITDVTPDQRKQYESSFNSGTQHNITC